MLVAACGVRPHDLTPLKVGDSAPVFAATTLAGDVVSLTSQHGSPVVLNIWATWCVPCRRELPFLDSLSREYSARGVQVIGVSIDSEDAAPAIASFIKAHAVSFTILHDPGSVITSTFKTRGVPETFLIDARGVIRNHWIGAVDGPSSNIRQALDSIR